MLARERERFWPNAMTQQPFRGTEYLTVDAFLDLVETAGPGETIRYAVGDLAFSAAKFPDLFALRRHVWRLHEAKRIALTQRACTDRPFVTGGGRSFEYLATRRRDENQKGEK